MRNASLVLIILTSCAPMSDEARAVLTGLRHAGYVSVEEAPAIEKKLANMKKSLQASYLADIGYEYQSDERNCAKFFDGLQTGWPELQRSCDEAKRLDRDANVCRGPVANYVSLIARYGLVSRLTDKIAMLRVAICDAELASATLQKEWAVVSNDVVAADVFVKQHGTKLGSLDITNEYRALCEGTFGVLLRMRAIQDARGFHAAHGTCLAENAAERIDETVRDKDREDAERAFHEKWGDFESWSQRKESRSLLALLKALIIEGKKIVTLRERYDEEKQSNDDSVREKQITWRSFFPEVTGAFMFVKILDRSEGEALFSANDGPFVLHLSPGDSFNAFPGQLVNMTIHNRGDTQLMTTGRRLPVFWSGSSPGTPRVIPAYRPSRAKERTLLARLKHGEKALLARIAKTFVKEDGDATMLTARKAPPETQVRILFDAESLSLERVQLADLEGRALFCIARSDCSEGVAVNMDLIVGAGSK